MRQNWNIFIQENTFENVVCEMASILSPPQCVKTFVTALTCICLLRDMLVEALGMGNG